MRISRRIYVLAVFVFAYGAIVAEANDGLGNTTVITGDVSPLYSDTSPFSNSRSASMVATALSGLSGSPFTACHVWRSVTLLEVCRRPSEGPLSASIVIFDLEIGDDNLRYYLGASVVACVLFISVALITAIASLVLTKARGAHWRQLLIVGRYPQHLLFVFFYFFHTGISTMTTVVVFSDDLTTRITQIIPFLAWNIAWIIPSIIVYRNVPISAIFVKRFRDVSDEAEIEKELHRRLVALEKENEEAQARVEELRRVALEEEKRMKNAEDRVDVRTSPDDPSATASALDPAASATGDILQASPPPVKYPGEAGTPEEGGGGGLTSSPTNKPFGETLFKTIRDLIPEAEEDALMRHTDNYVEAAVRADDAEKERLRRATNLVYSRMLASQIQAMAFDDSAVQLTLTGRDRWEDRRPAAGTASLTTVSEDAEEDDINALQQQADLALYVPAPIADYLKSKDHRQAKSRTGFLFMWGGFFRHFKESTYWFVTVEFVVSLAANIAEGWRPVDANPASCYGPMFTLLTLFTLYFVAILFFRPYVIPLEMSVVGLCAFFQVVAAIFVIVAVINGSPWAQVGANVLSVCCIYLYVLKALLDVFLLIAPYLYSQEIPWPTSILTTYYFDTARKTSDAHFYERKARLRDALVGGRTNAKSSSRGRRSGTQRGGSPTQRDNDSSSKRSRAGSFSSVNGSDSPRRGSPRSASPNHVSGGGGADDAASADGRTSSASHQGIRPPQPQREGGGIPPRDEFNVREVDVMEHEAVRYRTIGGRRNAYVTSRGVPEELHPFTQVPLPGIIPLPPRDPMHMTRRQRKALLVQGRSKQLLGDLKVAELFGTLTTDDIATTGATDADKLLESTSGGGVGAGLAYLRDEAMRQREKERRKALQSAARTLANESILGGSGNRSLVSASDGRRSSWEVSSAASSGGGGAAQNDATLALDDDHDALMDVLLFTRGHYNTAALKRQYQTDDGSTDGRTAVVSPVGNLDNSAITTVPPSASALRSASSAAAAGRPDNDVASVLPRGLSDASPSQPTMDQRKEQVSQRLLAMLKSTHQRVNSRQQEEHVAFADGSSSIPRGGSPPRVPSGAGYRGAGVYAGTYRNYQDQRSGGLRTSPKRRDPSSMGIASPTSPSRRVTFADNVTL